MADHTRLLEDSEQGRLLRRSMRRTLVVFWVVLTLGCWFAFGLSWKVDGFRADGLPLLVAPLFFWWLARLLSAGLDQSIGKRKWKTRVQWPFRVR